MAEAKEICSTPPGPRGNTMLPHSKLEERSTNVGIRSNEMELDCCCASSELRVRFSGDDRKIGMTDCNVRPLTDYD